MGMTMAWLDLGSSLHFSWARRALPASSGMRHTGLTRWTRMERGRGNAQMIMAIRVTYAMT